jgi:RNA polymerase sigma factor (sigma-70 family)
VVLKVPRHEVGEVVGEVMESALKSAFGGVSVGEFRNWIHTIADRRIADHFRRNRLETTRLPDGSEEAGGQDLPVPPYEGTVDVQRALDVAVAGLSDVHRRIVDLYVFADMTAGDVAARTEETEANVHQVASRFRKRMKELLDEGEGDTGS